MDIWRGYGKLYLNENLGKRDTFEFCDIRIRDAWEVCGRQACEEFTWDTRANGNLGAKYTARCRFDRFYSLGLVASGFRTIGRTRVSNSELYPSDHWGIVCYFNATCKI